MRTYFLKELITLDQLYGKNYNNTDYQNRLTKLKQEFLTNEGQNPTHIFSSPGRAEILGNHTDHNHGMVLVASISCDILAVATKKPGNTIKICSEGFKDIIVNLNNLDQNNKEYGTSYALVKGVCFHLKSKGYKLGGFTAYLTSNIFKGAGVSSSAAYEVLIAEILNTLYLENKLTGIEKAITAQFAENVYFGKPCGLLDQSGIALGGLSQLDFKDTTNPTTKKLSFDFDYSLVITNTGGDHANLTDHYAQIRTDMHDIAEYFDKKVLRDVDYNTFMAKMPELKAKFSGRAILRAIHFYNENTRVMDAETAILNNDIDKFLKAVNESGISSLCLLQNCYVPSDTLQPVVLAIELSRQILKHGAVRVHGGGFAGSILAVVENSELANYTNFMQATFGNENVFVANIRSLGTTQVI